MRNYEIDKQIKTQTKYQAIKDEHAVKVHSKTVNYKRINEIEKASTPDQPGNLISGKSKN